MDATLNQVISGLKDVFPEAANQPLDGETRLSELPEWDSMAAVNLQTQLQQIFGLEIPLELLGDDTRLAEVHAFICDPVKYASAS